MRLVAITPARAVVGQGDKLGDRIAIFGAGGRIAQYDTPGEILTHPADSFVAEFVGSGAAVRRLSLLGLATLDLDDVEPGLPVTVPLSGTVYDAVDAMLDGHASRVAVVGEDGTPVGSLRWDALVGELKVRDAP